jgi:putative peptidoglycan lipid II flippase
VSATEAPVTAAYDASNDDLRRGSSAVAAGILLSRLAGLVREIVTARFLGTGVGAEAFRAALRVPNLLQNLLGEGVLSASFVPVHSRMVADGRAHDAGRLAGAVVGILVTVVVVIVSLTVVFARPITRVLAWGFVPGTERFELTVTLVRIVTPGVGLLVVSAWCLAILNSHRRFFLAYVAPVVWNAGIVAALVTVALVSLQETTLARAMAWGALIGSLGQLLVLLPTALRLSRGLRVSLDTRVTGVRTVGRRFVEVLAGRGGVQIGGYVDLLAASLLAFGAVAAIGYAQVLYLLPVALFGMSVAASELPTLSAMDHTDRDRVRARLDAGLGRVAFFVLPAAALFLVGGDLVVATVFGGGRFSADAAVQVGIILAAYAIGLPASTASRLFQSVLYGIGDARSPAKVSLERVCLAAVVGVALMLPLDTVEASTEGLRVVAQARLGIAPEVARAGPDNLLRLGGVGLALGASVGAWWEVVRLRRRLRPEFGSVRIAGVHGPRVVGAACVAGVAGALARPLATATAVPARMSGIIVALVVGGVHLLLTAAAGVPEARELPRPSGR